MGNGYFRTSQSSTRPRDKRQQRGKDIYSYHQNYVDRVRLEDTTNGQHDPHCPQLRAAGWRHTHKSISHLDLATSCHGAAGAGLDQSKPQLHDHKHSPCPQSSLLDHAQPHWTQCRVGGQLRNARSLDYTQLEREENALDIAEFYWHFDAEAELDDIEDFSPQQQTTSTAATADITAGIGSTTAAAAALFDFGNESCSLRRSRSLAVIREETFSDLQINSANSSRRRSQLIPRARLVNRGFLQQQQQQQHQPLQTRLNCNSHKQQATVTDTTATTTIIPADDSQNYRSAAGNCDAQQQQQQAHHHCQHHQRKHQLTNARESRDFEFYYDNLKRLDALALGLSEQLHPWHNDKSDLESLNSEYFKNSLHQSHETQQTQEPSSLEFEALEQAVNLLSERPRIYQSRRKQQLTRHHCNTQVDATEKSAQSGAESCPEHSQSSVFPETTTSNSDDQTDSPSLSEQEYDLTHIEKIYQQTQLQHSECGEESYELISLTTTTHTRLESSEEEEAVNVATLEQNQSVEETISENEAGSESTLKRSYSEQLDKLIAYDSVYLSSEDSSECTLIGESCESFEQRTFTSCLENGELETRSLLHISIEDTVYEPQPKQHKGEAEKETQTVNDEGLLTTAKIELIAEAKESQLLKQVLRIEHTPSQSTCNNVGVTSSAASKPKILSVVEKRKLKSTIQEEPRELHKQPPQLKRQATDSIVVSHKSNLADNQYHSLPDVNIGQCLKVSECIDAELRSSYNLQKYQRKESNSNKQSKRQRAESEVVTNDEIYDSIRRFGRAHQKARQLEYEEQKQREQSSKPEAEAKHSAEVPQEKRSSKCKTTASLVISVAFKQPATVQIVEQEDNVTTAQVLELIEDQTASSTSSLSPTTPASNLDVHSSDADSQPEKPKEAPFIEVTNFTKLIERRAQEIKQKKLQRQPFQIIVTDTQNNIIEQDAIPTEIKRVADVASSTDLVPTVKPTPVSSGSSYVSTSLATNRTASLKRHSSKTKRQLVSEDKPPERRMLSSSTPIYRARPVKVLTSGDSFRRSAACGKMSRPQILHVVDSSTGGTMRRRSSNSSSGSGNGIASKNTGNEFISNVSNVKANQAENEYLQKVDAVRFYWSRLAGSEQVNQVEASHAAGAEAEVATEAESAAGTAMRQFKLGAHETAAGNGTVTLPATGNSDYCSFFPPSIEIVELGDGADAQKATIVSANASKVKDNNNGEEEDEDEAQFDHIRYKVLKSQQLIRSNILTARNKKEAQFDGLIQYLQDYSFQELLSNNNVVIVEPVRTKIEKPLTVGGSKVATKMPTASTKPNKQQEINTDKQNQNLSTQRRVRQRLLGNGSGLKRHFFYQPVRVNRELYEDELPDPDTVRNVRQFFEQHILPTPGQGLLVQSQKFGGSACQLSPKSRRARKYRYLTIDTSFGGATESIEQPKGMEMLEEHKSKHWDNASLSSGISSGDLSSPCGDCQHENSSGGNHKESPVLACKDVHVQDVVRRHNSNAANAKLRAKVSRRTWCSGGDSRYRQIYEHNLDQVNGMTRQTRESVGERQDMFGEEEDDDDNNEDDDDDDDDDVAQDMCESYYVSNDVLAKIRECGSTVTYYGGRVLERTTQANTLPQQNQQMPSKIGGSLTKTRTRVRQIEACNVCLPSQRCVHHLQTMQGAADKPEQQHDSYQGIKFKLVKSNSCSSRLELAGATESETEMEVVRKMVHHFERNQATPTVDSNLTINSQSTGKAMPQSQHQPDSTQVTVNNHINVLKMATTSKCENFNGQHDADKQPEIMATTAKTPTTYQSQAMNIRLDVAGGRADKAAHGNKNNSFGKVCRNKNVDLAYTLAKHSQPPLLVGASGNQRIQTQKIEKPYSEPDKQQQQQQNEVKTFEMNATNSEVIKQTEIIAQQQIIVPVEIHQQKQEQQQQQQQQTERRLSNASSSASIVDKSVVRHYVANDKSLFEKRKYDDIEFEEFEVYDPAKDQERQQPKAEDHKQHSSNNDVDLYDSLDDKL